MFKIALLPGDGIGPEVMDQAIKVLREAAHRCGLEYTLQEGLIGGNAVDATGEPLPAETGQLVLQSDAVLLGAIGGPKWDGLPVEKRPEKGLLDIRKKLGLYANLRPVKCWPQLIDQSPFKREIVDGVDLLVVRELIGGAYFGARGTQDCGNEIKAYDTIEYSSSEIKRILQVAIDMARQRGGKLTLVDKANVLDTSRLWRRITGEMLAECPDIQTDYVYVDNCAMQLCRKPGQFDVIVTENMFGDILSDQASVLGASLGMLPSASTGEGPALFEPAHGSAPDIAGEDKANPIAAILSVAMMLRIVCHEKKAADEIESAVNKVLDRGLRTDDIMSEGKERVGTKAMGEAIVEELISM